MRVVPVFVFAFACALGLGTDTHGAQKPDVKPCVTFASSWEAAVEEAKLLNVPIVLHSHGFRCPPCWGMHRSVLQNKDYIKFAERNTVEVLSLSDLEEGRRAGDDKAASYTDRKSGRELMVEWPNLTYDQIVALRRGKAGSYNDTGKIPFTAIIDPYTEEEVARWSGSVAGDVIIAKVEELSKQLLAQRGKGISRREMRDLTDAEAAARVELEKGEFSRALGSLAKVEKGAQQWPAAMRDRVAGARAEVVRAAAAALDEIERNAAEDPREAVRELTRLSSRLRGTGLLERARELQVALRQG